ncbi:MAG: polysaccharide deacetylase family protein [Nitrospirae bacterium]|nr:polysaccharide deacetylase family protein [Nitrospirota bacterium]
MKYAILSMDVEDWYHIDYFNRTQCDSSISLLDGVKIYKDILAQHHIKSTFFVLGELVKSNKLILRELAGEGHEIASHGWEHVRPLRVTLNDFHEDLLRSKLELEDTLGIKVQGYRAPCFSLNRERLDAVSAASYLYDSSRILFSDHPLYGKIDIHDFVQLSQNIYRKDIFFEFQVSTLLLTGRNIPVSGGGYIRIFPWFLMKNLIKKYIKHNELYVLYIHPFELSSQSSPPLPISTRWMTRKRFEVGRSTVHSKLSALIMLLRNEGYSFTTFAELRNSLLKRSI